MRVRLVLCVVLLCGMHVGFGRQAIAQAAASCGSEHNTDLDGAYVSSTSDDKCSGGSSGSFAESSYRLNPALQYKDQIIYFLKLCDKNVLLNGPEHVTKEVALALFRIAADAPKELRTVGQKNAVACLSYVDPVMAMDLLSKITFQRPGSGEWVYEDPRYNAAETVFANFSTIKPFDTSSIAEKARHLGQTGQYPYVAVGRIVHLLPNFLSHEKNALVRDALDFYSNETGFYNRDEEFLRFLELLKDSSPDKELAVRALATFVSRLKQNPIHIPGDYYAEIHIASIRKVVPFFDRNKAFLFQVFPQIQRLSPAIANELRQQDPALNQATGTMSYISGGFVQGEKTFEEAARQHFQWLRQALLARIQEYRNSNPQVAFALTQRLPDLSSNMIEVSAERSSVARRNLSDVYNIHDGQLSNVAH